MRRYLLLSVLALLTAVGCASAPAHPAQVDIDNANAVIASVKPGDPVEKIMSSFEPVHLHTPHCLEKVGIIDADSYQTANATTRTIWIGFYYFDGSPVAGQRRLCAFTIVNGLVESVYKP